ncbi:hypothetical protein BT96DRAFT_1004756 [Gymnopus androsaceus JB14]|uniref:Uncharacterized protein n=1 Tax=Gymnopus androsaceus JB14 TaxID=1447944 RepID=A0A6A4GQC3_9AGAR|nr:hypothetical protein BT96DRAFT_1004756 [Gymnopus androsaceus JB14]
MVNTRQQAKDDRNARDDEGNAAAMAERHGRQVAQRGAAAPAAQPRAGQAPEQSWRPNGSLLHLLNEHHVDPIPRQTGTGRAPASAPPGPIPPGQISGVNTRIVEVLQYASNDRYWMAEVTSSAFLMSAWASSPLKQLVIQLIVALCVRSFIAIDNRPFQVPFPSPWNGIQTSGSLAPSAPPLSDPAPSALRRESGGQRAAQGQQVVSTWSFLLDHASASSPRLLALKQISLRKASLRCWHASPRLPPLRSPFQAPMPPPRSPRSQRSHHTDRRSRSPRRRQVEQPSASTDDVGEVDNAATELKGGWGDPNKAQMHSYTEPFRLEPIANNLVASTLRNGLKTFIPIAYFASRYADSTLKPVESADSSAIILDGSGGIKVKAKTFAEVPLSQITLNDFNSIARHPRALAIADLFRAMFDMVQECSDFELGFDIYKIYVDRAYRQWFAFPNENIRIDLFHPGLYQESLLSWQTLKVKEEEVRRKTQTQKQSQSSTPRIPPAPRPLARAQRPALLPLPWPAPRIPPRAVLLNTGHGGLAVPSPSRLLRRSLPGFISPPVPPSSDCPVELPVPPRTSPCAFAPGLGPPFGWS